VAEHLSRSEDAAHTLTAMSRPFLNWAGKAERLSFDVPTLPLFVHERLSTKAILETLKGHKRDKQLSMFELFGDPQRPIHDQVLRAYEYPDNWVNRLILGDCDYILWYAKDKERIKYNGLFLPSTVEGDSHWNYVELPSDERRELTADEIDNHELLPDGAVVYQLISLYPTGSFATGIYDFEFDGVTYRVPPGKCWKTPIEGMRRLAKATRLQPYEAGSTLRYVLKHADYPVSPLGNVWQDTSAPSDKRYVVQTSNLVVQRCVLMTTDPGDLVLDPTCGSGTTAYVAEQWGRRWITTDTSRVPLALARQRLLTATFPFYQLKEEKRGPAGGFVYVRKQNAKGEEVGGIVPHVTLKSIANNEPPEEEVLVDRPEVESKITRVTGAFCVEATIPTPVDWEGDGIEDSGMEPESYGSFVDRMLEVLRKSPVLHVGGAKTVTLRNVRQPAKTLSLSAEAVVVNGNGVTAGEKRPHPGPLLGGEGEEKMGEGIVSEPSPSGKGQGEGKAAAIVFGPENGAVSEKLVYEAAREAYAKSYTHLYVIGFAIQPNARELVEKCEQVVGVPATYVQATPDLMMGDLLKNMRSSQIFSVCGLPEVKVRSRESRVRPRSMRLN